MGVQSSRPSWEPPPEPVQMSDISSPVDYHLVGSQVALEHSNECSCYPKVTVTMDSEELYSMLGEQYRRGYRLLHFDRAPADMHTRGKGLQVIFQGYFRMNPNLGEKYGDPISWELRVERSWIQTLVQFEGILTPGTKRVVHMNALVDSITRNTQNGERLVSAAVTGHCQPQSSHEASSGYGPHNAVDLFFEVPCPVPDESYIYNIALVPVHAAFGNAAYYFFPNITCDWMTVFTSHLKQGWRLVDIYIDYPMVEQLRTPLKLRRRLCADIQTNALWIFEKPRCRQEDCSPQYEGTIVEQQVSVKPSKSGLGVRSSHDWMPAIRDMGSRGWELACAVECHSVDASFGKIDLKSLLFFQRPLA